MSDVASTTRTLEDRVRELEDERDVLRTLHQYVQALDDLVLEQFLDCFTEDGVFETQTKAPWAHANNVRLQGHDELAAYFHRRAAGKGDPPRPSGHHMVTPDIRIQGDEAIVKAHFAVYYADDEGPGFQTMGRYRDVLVRCADGRWRFKERQVIRHSLRHMEGTTSTRPPRAPA